MSQGYESCGSCFTCCAAQPFLLIGLVKGLIAGAVLAPLVSVAMLVTAILMWPHDIVFTYRAVALTKLLGPNLKALALLLLPVPLLLYPVFVAVGGLFAGFGVGFFNACQLPKDTECSCLGLDLLFTCSARLPIHGFAKAGQDAWKFVCKFWDFMLHSYFHYLRGLIQYSGPAYDIRFIQLLMSLLVAPLGGLLGLASFTLILWKLPFGVVRLEYEIVKAYIEVTGCFERCLYTLPWLLALALVPAGLVVAAALAPLFGIIFGFTMSGVKAYQADNMLQMLPAGLSEVYQVIRMADEGSSQAVFGSKLCTCLPHWKYAVDAPPMPHVAEPKFPSFGAAQEAGAGVEAGDAPCASGSLDAEEGRGLGKAGCGEGVEGEEEGGSSGSCSGGGSEGREVVVVVMGAKAPHEGVIARRECLSQAPERENEAGASDSNTTASCCAGFGGSAAWGAVEAQRQAAGGEQAPGGSPSFAAGASRAGNDVEDGHGPVGPRQQLGMLRSSSSGSSGSGSSDGGSGCVGSRERQGPDNAGNRKADMA